MGNILLLIIIGLNVTKILEKNWAQILIGCRWPSYFNRCPIICIPVHFLAGHIWLSDTLKRFSHVQILESLFSDIMSLPFPLGFQGLNIAYRIIGRHLRTICDYIESLFDRFIYILLMSLLGVLLLTPVLWIRIIKFWWSLERL